MSPGLLRQMLRKQPFQSFRLYVSDGASYDIVHPENLQVARTHVELEIPASTLPGCPVDRVVYISLIHITRVEVYIPR